MNRINELKDETIKTLAQTLKASKLAASESEAIRMATNMAQTNRKVNTNFEERKEKNIMGLSFLHKEYKKETPKTKEIIEETYSYEEPTKYKQQNHQERYQETQEFHTKEDCASYGSYDSENYTKNKTLNEVFEIETKDEIITQNLIEQEEIVEKTQEIPVNKNKPKKDISGYKEAKVNLGDVFKFKG